MSITNLLLNKITYELRLIHILEKKPKQNIKLDPIQPEDYLISLEAIKQWSEDNHELYNLVLENGMAEYICNFQFLFEFYRHLSFQSQKIEQIDSRCLKLVNLKVLNLTQNSIKVIENIPPQCKELYLDFNQIESISTKQSYSLELLSISCNSVGDNLLDIISDKCKQLRCLNISWNRIERLKEFVQKLNRLTKLKVLLAYGNPISMLSIYHSYITEQKALNYIDGTKFIKKQPVKVEAKPIEQKKEVKEEKKQSKKDSKKTTKVEQKVVQQVKPQPKIQIKKQLVKQDFEESRIKIKVTNLQNFIGCVYDSASFPPDIDVKKTQTSYWIKAEGFGEVFDFKSKQITFDNAITQNQEIRINLDCEINKNLLVSFQNLKLFNEGVKIEVFQMDPKMVKDMDTFELKPEIINNQLQTVTKLLGATRIDLRNLHGMEKKEMSYKFRLFPQQAVNNPLFFDPYLNEEELIVKLKGDYEKQLKKREEEKLKKAEEQQILKQQKKGGGKKAPEKKAVKKQGKDTVLQKKRCEKCEYPVHPKQYTVVSPELILKGKQLICLQIKIE